MLPSSQFQTPYLRLSEKDSINRGNSFVLFIDRDSIGDDNTTYVSRSFSTRKFSFYSFCIFFPSKSHALQHLHLIVAQRPRHRTSRHHRRAPRLTVEPCHREDSHGEPLSSVNVEPLTVNPSLHVHCLCFFFMFYLFLMLF
ncbi:hypothetical protein RJT34_24664 [Clitoria ternatea]|uniref:Uncharacterized protein n=1 Tax=Clitoria ternatea TaxID=43366 RepID=A0AAN9II76_CLITE